MSLAHGKLANEKDLPEQERDRHKTEARRWYDQAVKQIDSAVARGETPWPRPSERFVWKLRNYWGSKRNRSKRASHGRERFASRFKQSGR